MMRNTIRQTNTVATVTLVEPTLDLAFEFLTMAYEFQRAGDSRFVTATDNFAAYMQRLQNYADGVDLAPGHVPSPTFWLLGPDGALLGTARLRHRLTPDLEFSGGHIGYDIRPSQRRKGYGTLILKLMLDQARLVGLDRALITCHPDNIASARVIQKNGGIFQDEVVSSNTGEPLARYWIDL